MLVIAVTFGMLRAESATFSLAPSVMSRAFWLAAGELVVVEGLAFDAPKTKQVASLLNAFEAANQKALLITDGANENVALSARNMPKVTAITNMGLNCFDILNSKKVFLAKDVVEKIEEVLA